MRLLKKTYEYGARLLLVLWFCASVSLVAAQEEPTYTLNFKQADIKDLIKFVADATGYTVIIDPKVSAKVDVISKKPLNKKELYDIFLSVLDVNDYGAVRNGGVLRIVKNQDIKTESLPVVSESTAEFANKDYVTEVFDLNNIAATELIPIMRPLIPRSGHIAAYKSTNAVVVTATVEVVRKIRNIVNTLDTVSHTNVEIVKLKHSTAEEMVSILTEVAKASGDDKNKDNNKALGLIADERTNSVIVSGTLPLRQKMLTLIEALDISTDTSGNNVVYLKHADAKDLAIILAKIASNMLKQQKSKKSESLSIEADEATNALIITGSPSLVNVLMEAISRLDIPRQLVLIEAIIVEVSIENGRAFGLEAIAADKDRGFGGFGQGGSGSLAGVFSGALSDDDDEIDGLASGIASISGGFLGGIDIDVANTSFGALITAIESNADTNVLSTPSLMTLNNNEAEIIVGQEVPILTGQYSSTGNGNTTVGNPFQTIERKDVGITLRVTPHVNEGGNITLDILQEASSIGGSASAVQTDVVTNERKIETKVITRDGEMIVLGGLMQESILESVSKVPVLGDIPFIGRLFKRSSTDVRKTNLMVFIRPTVINRLEERLQVTEKYYNHSRRSQLQKLRKGIDLYDESVMTLLPDWQESIDELDRQQQEQPQTSSVIETSDDQPKIDEATKQDDLDDQAIETIDEQSLLPTSDEQ